MARDFKETLNLPKTDFPMKADLPHREPNFLKMWEEIKLYDKLMSRAHTDVPKYVLHDGPPYANGDIHVGHALNKVLKDIVCRYHWMKGEYAPFIPGWDCHGQPIEHQVEKQLGEKKNDLSKAKFRELCKKYAEKYIDRQREQFKRLGVIGTWDKPYLTMDLEYEATNVEVFKKLYRKGIVYRGKKPIYWCYHDMTALAEAEIEYYEKESTSLKVKFELLDEFKNVAPPIYGVIWTTTAWTLPANVALAFHPRAEYSIYDTGEERLIFATSLADENIKGDWKEIQKVKGLFFEGKKFKHALFPERISEGIVADFVSLATGTGIVHIAPGHGEEDYLVGEKYDLPVIMPVDDKGVFTDEAGIFAGLQIEEANQKIVEFLEKKGLLFEKGKMSHSYPHCWRCKNPVIFRATEQWFIAVKKDGLKGDALDAIKAVKWIPRWSVNRITSMVEERPDWCISRQRAWGVPIPIIYCRKCGMIQDKDEVFDRIIQVFRLEGADSWFRKEAKELLPANYSCSRCRSQEFRKEEDIFDVWFESGISHFAVLKKREEVSWPADMYLEGSDQHRGWFQSSLLTSAGVEKRAPYREVLTHGFIVDEQGRKMSKSLGNVVDPLEVMDKMGADVLRMAVAASDYSSDVAISDQILERISDAYRRIRNTFRFMLGNLYDFDKEKNWVIFEEMDAIDKFIIGKLYNLSETVSRAYAECRYHTIVHNIHNFCTGELSGFYLDVLKDRLYAEHFDSPKRRSTQTALYTICRVLAKYLAPILPFTMEEVWQHLPGCRSELESVHLSTFETIPESAFDKSLLDDWDRLLEVRKYVMKTFETVKEKNIARTLLESKVSIASEGETRTILTKWQEYIPVIIGTTQIYLTTAFNEEVFEENDTRVVYNFGAVKIAIEHAEGTKCLRCWNWTSDVGEKREDVCNRCAEILVLLG